jgi:phage shock protein PspC (stress-responsive transcriptional regulator)
MRTKIIAIMLVFTVLFSFGVTTASYAEDNEKIEHTQQTKHLHLSKTDKMIGGVCGGLAEYFGIDVSLVRVGFVLGALFGAGEVAYIVLWIVLPSE